MRFLNIFLQTEWIFRLTPLYSKQKKCLKVLHDFSDDVIVKKREELVKEISETDTFGQDFDSTIRNCALLNILLQSSINGEPLSNEDIREEVDTFMFAGHDTTTSGIAFCLYNLAKHPEAQRTAFQEIKSVIGDDVNKPISLQDLNDLHYLDLVIKESLRLFPSVPFFGREVQENIEISMNLTAFN